MNVMPLTIQAYLEGCWTDIAKLDFNDKKQVMSLTYLNDYNFEHFLADNCFSISINYPVELFAESIYGHWLPILDDIIPAGASRNYWMQRLDMLRLPIAEQNYELLKNATIAPVGHLRIKEAVPTVEQVRYFSLEDIINRDVDFLEYASEQGAMAGGATGAGGEAPKLLLRCHSDKAIWIDNQQLADSDDKYYLVKYPRGKRSSIDCDILRAEFHYYQELKAMGFNTIDTDGMRLIEGKRYPSLWLPRFDIAIDKASETTQQTTQRFAMESIYSMLKKGAGAYLNHETTIRDLITLIEASNMVAEGFYFDKQAFILEWVQRDLLNIAFGNSDNHGRNTAFMRDERSIWLAPIYDFAPMKADPEGIVRTIKWKSENRETPKLESGGSYRFDLIAEQLSDLIAPELLLNELNITASKLLSLKSRLADRGVPKQILEHPNIGFDFLPDKLKEWRLL